MHHVVWTIGGSDCSARSGIQTDLQTITSLGADSCSVITAVTAQNSLGVSLVEGVSEQMLRKQLDCLAADNPVKVIKIGLITSIAQVAILVEKLIKFKQAWALAPYIIYDPVAFESTANNIVEEGVVAVIKSDLLPCIDLLTADSNEVFTLSGHALISGESFKPAAQKLISMGCKSVLIKGDCFSPLDEVRLDYWTDGLREIALTSERFANASCYGYDGVFASAIAAVFALDYFIEDALVVAKAYLNQGLKAAKQVGQGKCVFAHCSWPTNKADFPEVVLPESKMGYELDLAGGLEAGEGFASCDTLQLGFYPVLDSVEWLEKVLKLGVKTLQLRIKDKPSEQVEEQVIAAIGLARKYQARLFINDYWQLAIKHQAYGVHLGQQDMEVADLPMIADAGLRLGLSTHGYYEMLRAKQLRPSYIALGHIYETQTKVMPSEPQGVERLQKQMLLLDDIATVAIGGINLQRAPAICKTGVGSIAVVTAVTKANDFQAAIAEFMQIVKQTDSLGNIERSDVK